MRSHLLSRVVRLLAVFAVMLVILGNSTPVSATSCFTDLGACYERAALKDSWWGRFLAGLDCEVDLVACLEHAVAC